MKTNDDSLFHEIVYQLYHTRDYSEYGFSRQRVAGDIETIFYVWVPDERTNLAYKSLTIFVPFSFCETYVETDAFKLEPVKEYTVKPTGHKFFRNGMFKLMPLTIGEKVIEDI